MLQRSEAAAIRAAAERGDLAELDRILAELVPEPVRKFPRDRVLAVVHGRNVYQCQGPECEMLTAAPGFCSACEPMPESGSMEHSFDFYTRWCMCGVGMAEQMTNPSQCNGIAGQPRRFPLAESPPPAASPVPAPDPHAFDPARSIRNILRGFLEDSNLTEEKAP